MASLTGIPQDKVYHDPIAIRQSTSQDLDRLMVVERATWPPHLQFDREHFESHLEVFPEGSICASMDDQIVGYGVIEIIDYKWLLSLPEWTWYAATDNGFIRNSHNPNGDTMYGVSLSVLPDYTLKGVGEAMLINYARIAIRKNLRRALVEARIPLFSASREKHGYSVEQYVFGGKARELNFYERVGMKVGTILSNYVEDPESCNYAVIMHWDNPLFVS